MSFSYSGDPKTSDRDELRFLIQDTDSAFGLLQDEEIDYLLSEWRDRYDSVTYTASIAAAVISRKFTGVVSVTADGVSVNTADLADRYRQLATALREEYKAGQVGGAIDLANLLIDTDRDESIKPLVFGMGHMDNPSAGQQSYGSVRNPFVEAEISAGGS